MTLNTTKSGVFTRAGALSNGMTRRQVGRLGHLRVLRGVYADDPTSLTSRIRAGLMVAGPQAAICGVTALRFVGVDLPQRMARDPRIWIQVPYNQHWPRSNQLRLVRARRPGVTALLNRIPIVELPVCWFQLAAESSLDEMVELADAMTCRQHPVTSLQSLWDVVERHVGARGVTTARAALELAMELTEAIPETDLRLLLVRAGLKCPVVSFAIRDRTGRVVFWLDLAYPEAKLAIEYDGAIHVGDRSRMERDQQRRRALEDLGWRIITVTARDMAQDPLGVIRSVSAALAERTPR